MAVSLSENKTVFSLLPPTVIVSLAKKYSKLGHCAGIRRDEVPEGAAAFASVGKSEDAADFPDVLVVEPEVLLNGHDGHEVAGVAELVCKAEVVRYQLGFELKA